MSPLNAIAPSAAHAHAGATMSGAPPAPPPPPLGSCVHLQAFKASLGVAAPGPPPPPPPPAPTSPGKERSGCAAFYSNLLRNLLAPASPAGRANRAQALACHSCGAYDGRIHVCLHCIHFACFPDHWQRHRHKEKYSTGKERKKKGFFKMMVILLQLVSDRTFCRPSPPWATSTAPPAATSSTTPS